MKWDYRTEILAAKKERSTMRNHALEARLVIHPSERFSWESFSEMCERAANYLKYAIAARNRAIAHEIKAAELKAVLP